MQKNKGIKYGIIAGVATIGYMLLFYFMDRKLMLNHMVYHGSWFIYLGLMFTAVFSARKANAGKIELRPALRIAFQTFIVANLCFHLFNYFLFSIYDPGLVQLQQEMQEAYLATLPETEREQWMKQYENMDFTYTFSTAIFSFAKGAIMGFILSFIVAGIARNQ